MTINRISPGERMSHSVTYNGVVYLSGVTAAEAGLDIKAQTARVLAIIDERLAVAGTDKSKILSAQIWVRDIAHHFAPMNEEWVKWLDASNPPARATVESNMARPEVLVEIAVIAAKFRESDGA